GAIIKNALQYVIAKIAESSNGLKRSKIIATNTISHEPFHKFKKKYTIDYHHFSIAFFVLLSRQYKF
ncbi:MAG: hypothetical protein ABI594_19260, partial [Ginsengibacter sp.]